jgi:hypothetical protein
MAVGVYLYDSNWVYNSTFPMPGINYGIVANNFYYFTPTSGYGIIKTSLTSPTVVSYYGTVGYRGLFYDTSTSRIIAAGCGYGAVYFFDLNLNYLSSVSVPNCPHGVTVYNSKIYVVSWYSGKISVFSDVGVAGDSNPTQCSSGLASISVDSFGYFALSCYDSNLAYIYNSSLQYTGKSIGLTNVFATRLDTNYRFGICGSINNVKIYN